MRTKETIEEFTEEGCNRAYTYIEGYKFSEGYSNGYEDGYNKSKKQERAKAEEFGKDILEKFNLLKKKSIKEGFDYPEHLFELFEIRVKESFKKNFKEEIFGKNE